MEKLDMAIASLYDAAADPALWPSALNEIASATGTFSSIIYTAGRRREDGGIWTGSAAVTEMMDVFSNYYVDHDVWRHALFKKYGGRPGLYLSDEMYPCEELVKTEFYNDFLRRQEVGRLVAMTHDDIILSVHRRIHDSCFEDRVVDVCSRLRPHVQRAYQLHNRLHEARQRYAMLEEALDADPIAQFLVDGSGRILHMNTAAGLLIIRRDCITTVQGRLVAISPSKAPALASMISAAARTSARRGDALSIAKENGRPYQILVVPLGDMRGGQVLVTINDPDAETPPDLGAILQKLYGLTPAEARVCLALMEDMTPAEIAEQNNVSRTTVVSQLRSVFSKTDTSRQSQLMRLLQSIPKTRPRR
jgi:DNA-binding CsgD family transcriptional regulator